MISSQDMATIWSTAVTVFWYASPFLVLALALVLLDRLVRLIFGWPQAGEEGAVEAAGGGGGGGLPPLLPPPLRQSGGGAPRVSEGAETAAGSSDGAGESSFGDPPSGGSGDEAATSTKTYTWS